MVSSSIFVAEIQPIKYGGKRETIKRAALFICKCGKKFEAAIIEVRNRDRSCGCRTRIVPGGKSTHGQTRGGATKEYKAWSAMIGRCNNSNLPQYKDYGGRGIVVCEKWRKDFMAFLKDVGNAPSPKHTLDRHPNNNGNYEPGNVRWATYKEQNRNRRSNLLISYKGESKTVHEWSEIYGINASSIYYRTQIAGWSIEDALKINADFSNKKNSYGKKERVQS